MADHGMRCAEYIRDEVFARGGTTWEAVSAVRDHCGVSLLRSNRLIHGWTLTEAVRRLDAVLVRTDGKALKPTHQRMSRWETSEEVPSALYLDALCRLYLSRPDRLGFGVDYSSSTGSEANIDHNAIVASSNFDPPRNDQASLGRVAATGVSRRRIISGLGAGATASLFTRRIDLAKSIRVQVENLLEVQYISATTVDDWDAVAEDYGHLILTWPIPKFIVEALRAVDEIRTILMYRQPIEYQKRLLRAMAQLAALIAIDLTGASDLGEARSWFRLARLAADETDDRLLRGWILAKEGSSYLWYGRSLERAVEMGRRAQAVAGKSPSPASILGASLEARALARLGDHTQSLSALRRATFFVDRLDSKYIRNNMLGFHPDYMLFYEGNVLTHLGEVSPAMRAQAQVANVSKVDRTQISLDRTECLIRTGNLDESLETARQAILALPQGSRSGIVRNRMSDVTAIAGAKYPGDRLVEELRNLLELC